MLFVSLITANYHQRLTIQLLSVWHKNISVFSETLLVIMNHRTCVFVNSSVCVCWLLVLDMCSSISLFYVLRMRWCHGIGGSSSGLENQKIILNICSKTNVKILERWFWLCHRTLSRSHRPLVSVSASSQHYLQLVKRMFTLQKDCCKMLK